MSFNSMFGHCLVLYQKHVTCPQGGTDVGLGRKNGRPGARRPAAHSDSHISIKRLHRKTPKTHQVKESVAKDMVQAAENADNAAATSPGRDIGYAEKEGIVSAQAGSSGYLKARHGDKLPPRNSGARAAHNQSQQRPRHRLRQLASEVTAAQQHSQAELKKFALAGNTTAKTPSRATKA